MKFTKNNEKLWNSRKITKFHEKSLKFTKLNENHENSSKINGEYQSNKLVQEVTEFISKDKKRPICYPLEN